MGGQVVVYDENQMPQEDMDMLIYGMSHLYEKCKLNACNTHTGVTCHKLAYARRLETSGSQHTPPEHPCAHTYTSLWLVNKQDSKIYP